MGMGFDRIKFDHLNMLPFKITGYQKSLKRINFEENI
jgi:hypothetical protein